MDALKKFLMSNAKDGLLAFNIADEAATHWGLSHHDVEKRALELNLLPVRYQRNGNTIPIGKQKLLFQSHVAVVGCGGLGGHVLEQLSRIGVGRISVMDPDVYEEHNLNRQIYCSTDVLGQSKVEIAAQRVGSINPAVKINPVPRAISKENGPGLLKGMDVVVDALDHIAVRFELSNICHRLGLPLIHGSVAGWYGQLAVQLPGREIMSHIYGKKTQKGIEHDVGNISFGVAAMASLEAAETVKLLLGQHSRLAGRVLFVDLQKMTFTDLPC